MPKKLWFCCWDSCHLVQPRQQTTLAACHCWCQQGPALVWDQQCLATPGCSKTPKIATTSVCGRQQRAVPVATLHSNRADNVTVALQQSGLRLVPQLPPLLSVLAEESATLFHTCAHTAPGLPKSTRPCRQNMSLRCQNCHEAPTAAAAIPGVLGRAQTTVLVVPITKHRSAAHTRQLPC